MKERERRGRDSNLSGYVAYKQSTVDTAGAIIAATVIRYGR